MQFRHREVNSRATGSRVSTSHVAKDPAYTSSSSSDVIEELKIKHNKECKGLFVQIRYLKAKYLREATLRGDLTYQKQYLLVLLARYERR